VPPEVLQSAYDAIVAGNGDETYGEKFIRTVMDSKETDERGPEVYDTLV
jgi:hypothetical protein